MPGKDQVGGGFSLPGIRIGIGAEEPRRLVADQAAAVIRLADYFVAGGGVQEHRRPTLGHAAGGRLRDPEVLADLHAHGELRRIRARIDPFTPEQGLLPTECDRDRRVRCGRKMARLIEFAVVWNMAFGREAQQLSPAEYGGHIVKRRAKRGGKAHNGQKMVRSAFLYELLKRAFRRLQQRRIVEEIAAGIACQAELREHNGADALLVGSAQQCGDGRFVGDAICHANVRGGGGDPKKPVIFHGRHPFLATFRNEIA